MASTFGVFETAKSGLSVAMQNLKITGHNIANANTVGYTRQRLVTSAKETGEAYRLLHPLEENHIGQGVEVLAVEQLRSIYLDQQYRKLNTSYSYSDSRAQALNYLEGLFNGETADSGLTASMEKYFEALNSFSQDTSSKEYRTNVQQQAIGLTGNFNNVYQEMMSLWDDQNTSLSTISEKVNSIAQKISVLNESIASYERTGERANDLNDERNLLLDELSGYVNITYENNPVNTSMVDVKIAGTALVSGTIANSIKIDSVKNNSSDIDMLTQQIAMVNNDISLNGLTTDRESLRSALISQLSTLAEIQTSTNADDPNLTDISFFGASLVSGTDFNGIEDASAPNMTAWVNLNRNNLTLEGDRLSIEDGTLTGGKLYANMEMVTGESASSAGIPYYMNQLNSLVQKVAKDINDIHKTGWTYQTDTAESITGLYFFKVPTKTDAFGTVTEDYSLLNAANFAISDEVLANTANIAGSSSKVVLDAGSTETGNGKIAETLYKAATNNDYYGSLNSVVGHLAIALNTTKGVLDTKESLVNSVDTQRTSISGVSVDEETTNLIVFQQAYSACARTITTIDEMLDVLINKTGVVGR